MPQLQKNTIMGCHYLIFVKLKLHLDFGIFLMLTTIVSIFNFISTFSIPILLDYEFLVTVDISEVSFAEYGS